MCVFSSLISSSVPSSHRFEVARRLLVDTALEERVEDRDPTPTRTVGTASVCVSGGSRSGNGYRCIEQLPRTSRARAKATDAIAERVTTAIRSSAEQKPRRRQPRPQESAPSSASARSSRGPQPTLVYVPQRRSPIAGVSSEAHQAQCASGRALGPTGRSAGQSGCLRPNWAADHNPHNDAGPVALQLQHSVGPLLSVSGGSSVSQPQAVADAFRSLADLIAPRPTMSPQIHFLLAPPANLSISEGLATAAGGVIRSCPELLPCLARSLRGRGSRTGTLLLYCTRHGSHHGWSPEVYSEGQRSSSQRMSQCAGYDAYRHASSEPRS